MDRKRLKSIFTGLAAALLMCCGCSTRVETDVPQQRTVPAVMGPIRKTITFVGNVTAAQSSTLSWQTTGVIESVSVSLGDRVSEGQVLATLEKDSLSAQVLNAEVPLIEARENLDEVLSSETPKAQAYKDLKDKEYALEKAEKYKESLKYPHGLSSDISYWEEQTAYYKDIYDGARASLDDAVSWKHSPSESDRNLYEERRVAMLNAMNNYAEAYNTYLYYSHHATENETAQAGADIDTAQAAYEKARKNFMTYVEYPRVKDVAAAQIRVDQAEDTYNRRNIVSDINGVITEIDAREGDYVTQSAAAFRIDNTDRLFVPMDVSELDIIHVREGMKARIVLDADTAKTYEGVVTTVSGLGTASGSRVTFETMVEFLEPDASVKVGMTAEVNLILDESGNALLVPANAVFTDKGNSYVSVASGSGSRDVPVTVGLTTETIAEITGGQLKEGDEVLVPSVDNSILKDMGLNGMQGTGAQQGPMNGGPGVPIEE